MAKGCEDCGVGLWDDGTPTCATCARARAKRATDDTEIRKLKVFQITIYKKRPRSELVLDTIIVLGTTEEIAAYLAFEKLGYLDTFRVKDENYHIWELDGPFGEGSILYRTPQ